MLPSVRPSSRDPQAGGPACSSRLRWLTILIPRSSSADRAPERHAPRRVPAVPAGTRPSSPSSSSPSRSCSGGSPSVGSTAGRDLAGAMPSWRHAQPTARALHRLSVADHGARAISTRSFQAIVDQARAPPRGRRRAPRARGPGRRADGARLDAVRRCSVDVADRAPTRSASVDPALAGLRLAAPLQRGGETVGQLARRLLGAAELRRRRRRDALARWRTRRRSRSRTSGSRSGSASWPSSPSASGSPARCTTASPRCSATSTRSRRPSTSCWRPVASTEARGAARPSWPPPRGRSTSTSARRSWACAARSRPERGLVGALEEYAARFADAVEARRPSSRRSPAARARRLAADVQAEVFRIVQEALTNVRKHAAAHRRGRLGLAAREGRLVVTVEDDGARLRRRAPTGPGPAGRTSAVGMRSRERAAAIGERRSTLGTRGPAGPATGPPPGVAARRTRAAQAAPAVRRPHCRGRGRLP